MRKIITIANLTAIFILNYTILSNLMNLFDETKEFMNIRSNVELIQEFIVTLPKLEPTANLKIPNPSNIRIDLRNITYYHEGNPEPLYRGLNLVIQPRERVVIMGSIGSGKSTFAKLITRLQTFESGDILINGVSITRIDINDLRRNILYIPQHPKLFNRTLWENISYGLGDDVTEEDIYKFLDGQGMTELSGIFRKRMHDSVGKHGTSLSGGQRQMVWLVRAVLKKSPVVILDEPSASLDPTSTHLVQKMIQHIGKSKTVILITHDKEFTKGMDRLIFFDSGRIIKDIALSKY
jgi:ABC-type bacteriocin/lantibiotic exporter with double-glycine peptidase domain